MFLGNDGKDVIPDACVCVCVCVAMGVRLICVCYGILQHVGVHLVSTSKHLYAHERAHQFDQSDVPNEVGFVPMEIARICVDVSMDE